MGSAADFALLGARSIERWCTVLVGLPATAFTIVPRTAPGLVERGVGDVPVGVSTLEILECLLHVLCDLRGKCAARIPSAQPAREQAREGARLWDRYLAALTQLIHDSGQLQSLYRLRQGKLERLTVDHTLLAQWEAAHQRPGPPEVRARAGHILTRALGGRRPGIDVDVRAVAWEPGDVFLLCSDGLHGLVSDDDMAEVIMGAPDLDRAVVRLLRRANEAAGHDNITAVLVRMLGD